MYTSDEKKNQKVWIIHTLKVKDASAKRGNVFQSCKICYLCERVCKCTSAISIGVGVKWHRGRILSSSPSAGAGLVSPANNLVSVRQTPKVTSWKRGAVPFGILHRARKHCNSLLNSPCSSQSVKDERQATKEVNRNSVKEWEDGKHLHRNTRKTLYPHLLWAELK